MSKRLITRYIFLLLSLAIMTYIFIMSAQTATVSTQNSGRVIRKIAAILVEGFEKKPEAYQIDFISSLQLLVRKAAHFIEFAALGFSVAGFVFTFDGKIVYKKSIIAFTCAFLYAVSDEVHQLFVPGRSCQISDMLLDAFGIICGILFLNLAYVILLKLIKRAEDRRAKNEQ